MAQSDFSDRFNDKEKKYILSKMTDQFNESSVDAFINDRLDANRDAKIIITARNSETGTGKTTLAVQLAKQWDRNGWSANKGFLDIKRYLAYYAHKARAGDVLILDDAEASADSRRSQSTTNVLISKYWSIMRVKNVVSLLTMPTASMLDKRLLELADLLMIVRRRGLAVPYRVYVNDISHQIKTHRWRVPLGDNGGKIIKPVITFGKDDSKEYVELSEKKDKFVKSEIEDDFDEDINKILNG